MKKQIRKVTKTRPSEKPAASGRQREPSLREFLSELSKRGETIKKVEIR